MRIRIKNHAILTSQFDDVTYRLLLFRYTKPLKTDFFGEVCSFELFLYGSPSPHSLYASSLIRFDCLIALCMRA